ncbi:hypothetical protein AAIB46_14980 [Streptomyces sp. 35M1]|uniref:hypothetical protein n=1 Tax=unclassified Streptomyces TaxID=2593676 RepID=UPI00340DA35C
MTVRSEAGRPGHAHPVRAAGPHEFGPHHGRGADALPVVTGGVRAPPAVTGGTCRTPRRRAYALSPP